MTEESSGTGLHGTAISVRNPGGIEALELVDIEAPEPEAGEVRIRQTAIGVNFIDVYCRRGEYKLLGEDGILGFEAAGVVESVGPGVSELSVGDRAAYVTNKAGAYSSVRSMPAEWMMRVPASITDEQIAAVLLKGATAACLITDVGPPSAGSTVVIHAAAGATGSLLCQWAATLDVKVIGIVSREEKAEYAQSCGADEIIVAERSDPEEEVLRLTGGKGAEVIYDGVGSQTFTQSLAMLAHCGYLVSFGQASGSVGTIEIGQLAAKSAFLTRPTLFHYASTPERLQGYCDSLFELISQGKIKVTICGSFPLSEAARAHEMLEGRGTKGSLVLTTG